MTDCPGCKRSKTLRPWEGRMKKMGVEVLARGTRCRACGETLVDAAELERLEIEAAGRIVERGIQTAVEFKFVRKTSGLRAKELAALVDVRPETVSRWESGQVTIPRLCAYALGELYRQPKLARARLELLAP